MNVGVTSLHRRATRAMATDRPSAGFGAGADPSSSIELWRAVAGTRPRCLGASC